MTSSEAITQQKEGISYSIHVRHPLADEAFGYLPELIREVVPRRGAHNAAAPRSAHLD